MFFFIHISVFFFSFFLCWSAFYIICILKMSLFLKFPIVKKNSKIKLLMQIVASEMSLGVLSAVIWCKLRSFLRKGKKKTINHSFPSVSLWRLLSFFTSFQPEVHLKTRLSWECAKKKVVTVAAFKLIFIPWLKLLFLPPPDFY